MSVLISDIITRARGLMHDRKDGHYIREFLNEQVNGTSTEFQMRNRNLLDISLGAPQDVRVLVNGVFVAVSSIDENPGLVNLLLAPPAGATLEVRYYFEMATDAEWFDFYRTAIGFAGVTTEVTLLTEPINYDPGLSPAIVQYCAAQSSRTLASLTHWYYSANAGNKSFNKDQVSKKFMEQAKEWEAQAEKLRLAVYERFDQNKAPAFAYVGTRGLRYWEPRR